jgi:4-hydroxy-3-methylbut-2-en-1-yl diphosphate synthase IspG/GcpE
MILSRPRRELARGEIGDTIRVSRSADPVEAVKAGFETLKALNLRRRGVTVISCPSCGPPMPA